MALWPEEKVLVAIFPELRVRRTLALGARLWPPFMVFIIVWTFVMGGGLKGVDFLFTLKNNYAVAICCVLFIALIPLQAYLWYDKRSNLKLNSRQKAIMHNVCDLTQRPCPADPVMYDFVLALNAALRTQPNKDFLNML